MSILSLWSSVGQSANGSDVKIYQSEEALCARSIALLFTHSCVEYWCGVLDYNTDIEWFLKYML